MKLRNLVIVMILLLCTGCSSTNTVREVTSNHNQKSEDKKYDYVNSTDIFSVEQNNVCQYDLRGENRRSTGLKIKNPDHSRLLYVDDSWLYYDGADEEGYTEGLFRVPLGKGDDDRSVVTGKSQKINIDLKFASDYAVVGNYVTSVSSKDLMTYDYYMANGNESDLGNDTVCLYNIKDGKKSQRELPDILDKIERKEVYKDWHIIGKGRDWVLWGGKGLFLQMIPSNELIVLEQMTTRVAGVWRERDIIYYTVKEDVKKLRQSCWQYDLKKKKKEKIITHKNYRKTLCQSLGISMKNLDTYEVKKILEKDGKIYIECDARYHVAGKENTKRSLLLWDPTEGGRLYFEQNLNDILHYLSDKKDNIDPSCLTGCVDELWFFANVRKQRAWVFNENTNQIKQFTDGGSEWHRFYALYSVGMTKALYFGW